MTRALVLLALLLLAALPARAELRLDLAGRALPPLAEIVLRGTNRAAVPGLVVLRVDDAPSPAYADRVNAERLVPPGPFALAGPPAVVAQFEQWFGGGRSFEVLSHSAGVVGTRVHARWTVRRTPDAPDASPLTAEQHAFLTADDRVRSIDLLCSGWQDAR